LIFRVRDSACPARREHAALWLIAIEVPPHGIAIDQQGVCYLCYRPTLAKQYGQYGSGRHCAYRTLRIL